MNDRLSIGTYQNPTEINPLTTDSSISANLVDLVFDTLMLVDKDGRLLPNIASSWNSSEDGLVWTIQLNKNFIFHDQHALSAADVKFTFDCMSQLKKSGYSGYLNAIKSFKTIDSYTIEITLRSYDSSFIFLLANLAIAPKHLLEGKKDFSDFNRHPVGSGPYKFVSQTDHEIVLEKNESYPLSSQIKKLVIEIFPNQKAVLNHLISEQIDMAFLVNPEDYGALDKTPHISIYDNWYPMLYMILFNEKEKLFSVNHRKVINLLIDKRDLLSRVLKQKGVLTKGTILPDSREYQMSDIENEYNPQKALKILQDEGWADHDHDGILDLKGKKFEFSTYGIEGEGVAEMSLRSIQKSLSEAGIRMNIKMLPFNEYIQKVCREQDFESNIVYFVFRSNYNNDFSFWHSSQIKEGLNFSHYKNNKVDQLLDQIRRELDSEKRINLNLEMEKELVSSPPGVFLFWRKMPIAVNKRFYNVPEKRMQNLRDIVNFKVH